MKRVRSLLKIVTMLLFLVLPSIVMAKRPPEPDMTIVLDNGKEVILHPDSTWEFAKFSFIQDDTSDVYMDLDDGRILCIKNDNSWGFVKKKPVKKKLAFAEVPSVTATATATYKTLDAAVNSARNKVFDKAATRLYKYAKKSKMTKKYLIACIKDEVGESGAEVSYKKGWTATAKLSLEKVQVKKILDCVIVQVEAGTGTDAAKK